MQGVYYLSVVANKLLVKHQTYVQMLRLVELLLNVLICPEAGVINVLKKYQLGSQSLYDTGSAFYLTCEIGLYIVQSCGGHVGE